MQLSFDDLEYVVGTSDIAAKMPQLRPLRPFDENVIAFLNDLSGLLRGNRLYPDVATFGFWCRKAAVLQEKSKYDDLAERIGKGIVFHSTPSNVPVNFAFSFAAGLLAGNANIIRLPAKPFEQVHIICDAVRQLLADQHQALAPYVCFVRFPAVKEISDAFSAFCDVRVIWGGDATIADIRRSALHARATEITFADRHSIAVIHADEYLKAAQKELIVQNFYNDTYYSDQNACTSPRIVFWLGGQTEAAQADFWQRVHALVKKKYALAPVQSVGKLHALCKAAAQKKIRVIPAEDMLVTRLQLTSLPDDLMNLKYNSGFFFEMNIQDLREIVPVCGMRCQTLSYFGIEKEMFRAFLEQEKPNGIDRIVPIGKTMDFSLIWDGYDLIRQMSRRVNMI